MYLFIYFCVSSFNQFFYSIDGIPYVYKTLQVVIYMWACVKPGSVFLMRYFQKSNGRTLSSFSPLLQDSGFIQLVLITVETKVVSILSVLVIRVCIVSFMFVSNDSKVF